MKRPTAKVGLFVQLARPERFELPTTWFVARYSIQLSYGRLKLVCLNYSLPLPSLAFIQLGLLPRASRMRLAHLGIPASASPGVKLRFTGEARLSQLSYGRVSVA